MKKNIIRIKSSLGKAFNSEVVRGKERYIVQTEDGGVKTPLIITRIYLQGRIIDTKETDYRDIIDAPDRNERVQDLMERQHQSVVTMLSEDKKKGEKNPTRYLETVKDLVTRRKEKEALEVLTVALEEHPDNLFLLSYYGRLNAVVNKKYKEGIDLCIRAVKDLKEKVPFGEEFFYPMLYLNLGKAYLAAGKKEDAIDAFRKGLATDSENREIRRVLSQLGIRKNPAVPFLRRSHVVNKYLGLLTHRFRR